VRVFSQNIQQKIPGDSVRRTVHFYPNVTALRSGICYRNSVCRLSVVCCLSVCNDGSPFY